MRLPAAKPVIEEGPPSLERIVGKTGDLPPIPATALRALEMTNDPQVSVRELQVVLAQDQALTARILRIANSSMYGLRREIGTVSHAVAILGLDTTRSILTAACVQQVFQTGMVRARDLGTKLLSDHSWGAGLCSRVIARYLRYAPQEEAFLAGLMHDIGKPVLLKNLPDRYMSIINDVYRGEANFHETELVVFGFSHAQVGAILAEKWNFPPQLVEAIGYHHDPGAAPKYSQLASITGLANKIMIFQGIGFERDSSLVLEELPAAAALRLDAKALQNILAETGQVLAQMPETLRF
jgi:putative nucleotidyltransferase with HDIG domain